VRRDTGRRRPISSQKAGLIGGAIVALVIVLIILISTLSPTHSSSAGGPILYRTAPTAYVTAVTQIPVAQLDAAGTGGSESSAGGFVASPKQPLLFSTSGGTKRPVLVYVGAEYCPYCAASRWPLIIALSRFGTFTGLGLVGSSPYDVYASTNTWSFRNAAYSSSYLVFEPADLTSNVCAVAVVDDSCPQNSYVRLETLSAANSQLFSKYDAPPYSATQQGIPFFDWGGRYISSGSQYVPNLINLGSSDTAVGWHPMTWQQIISNLKTTPLTPAGEGILGTANIFTAAICKMTSGQPASICGGPVIQEAQKLLPKS
jgi:thiol-disulfide isomerase/thioredoxin